VNESYVSNVTDRQMSQKRSTSACEMYLMTSVEWAVDHFGHGLT